jgi:uncharacterized membrane protein YphA (DoxX/SURF4 family)
MNAIAKQGRYIFAIAIIAFGALQIIFAHHIAPVPQIIPWLPQIPWLAYLAGAVFLATGICIVANIRARLAAMALGTVFLGCVLVLQIARMAENYASGGERTAAFETLSFCAAAFMLAGIVSDEGQSFGEWKTLANALICSGPYLFAISLIVFGYDHFRVIPLIAGLVPGWIPGSGKFWAYFTGASLVASGVGIATGILARWGAFLIGVMFLAYFLALHLPRILTYPRSHNPAELSSAFIALGMCGASWICAGHFARGGTRKTN